MAAIDRHSILTEALSGLHAAGLRETERKTDATADSKKPTVTANLLDPKNLLVNRIKAIRPDDAERKRKIFRAYLSFTLTTRMGENIESDPAYETLVDATLKRFEDDIELKSVIDRTVRILSARVSAMP